MNINWRTNRYLYTVLTEFLIESKIKYSCNVRKLCRSKGWHLVSYPDNKFIEFCNISNDGFSVYKQNEFYILYNPFNSENRINFTIAHEIGHIALYHHSILNKPILTKGKKDISEYQANIFARNILMPISITKEQSKIKNIIELSEQFGVSEKMATYRLQALERDILNFKKVLYLKNKLN